MIVDFLDVVDGCLLFLFGELVPFAVGTGDVLFGFLHRFMIFIPENVEHFGFFFLFFFAGFRRDAAGPEIIVVDMNVEDSFLVRDDLDNALFLDFLKEAEGFGSAPLEELAPVLLADDGFSALAYNVDLLNLVRGFRVVGVYQDLEERFQFSRSFIVYLAF